MILFIAIAVVVSAVLVRLIQDSRQRAEALAYAMVLGGAIGNVIDRVFRGYVVDYLDFHWQSWHWPAFNLADIFIVLGVIMILVTGFRTETSRGNEAENYQNE